MEKTYRQKTNEHMFSIELKSKECIKCIALPNGYGGNVLIEGYLGKLETFNFTDGIMLNIKGTNGNLRMDFSLKELQALISQHNAAAGTVTDPLH